MTNILTTAELLAQRKKVADKQEQEHTRHITERNRRFEEWQRNALAKDAIVYLTRIDEELRADIKWPIQCRFEKRIDDERYAVAMAEHVMTILQQAGWRVNKTHDHASFKADDESRPDSHYYVVLTIELPPKTT